MLKSIFGCVVIDKDANQRGKKRGYEKLDDVEKDYMKPLNRAGNITLDTE